MSDPIKRLANEIVAIRRRVDGLGAGPQLAYSSLEAGSIDEYDGDGKLVGVIGEQWDGTHGAFSISGPPPPRPTAPITESGQTGSIGWDGVFANDAGQPDISITAPMDWSRVELHMSRTSGFIAETADTLVDSIESPRGGTRPVLGEAGTWYAVLVARSLSGKASPQSAETALEITPGVTEADIEAVRESFAGFADELQSDLSTLATEQAAAKERLDDAQDKLDAIPGQLETAQQAALAAVAAFVEEALAQGQNLLPNGGFEEGITGWQDNAGGVVTAAAARSGALGMHLDPALGNVWPLSNMMSTAGGRKYHIEMWVRRTGTDTWSTQSIGFVPQTRNAAGEYDTPVVHIFNADGTPLRTGDISTTAFTRVEAEFTVGQADATEIGIAPWFYESATNKYDVDDIALVDISAISLQVDKAKAEAIAAASLDATTKAEAAKSAAILAADLSAQAMVDASLTAAASTATEIANATKAQAIEAAALDAQNKAAAAQEAASDLARSAQTTADNAAQAAGSATGIANGKSVVLFQTAAPGAEYRNVRTLWIDTTGNANTPKRWTTGTTWVAQTDKVAVDAAVKAAAAETAANNAASKAASAESTADSALAAAGSLNKVFYSTANPSGIAPVGSTWRKQDAAGNIIGEWRYTGGTPPWVAQLVTTEAISNVDIGKLTVGSGTFIEAVAEKMAIATAAIQKADIGNLTVTGASKLSDVVAERIAANVGSFVKLYANQVYIGEGGNLFPTDFMDSTWQSSANATYSATGGRSGGSSVLLNAATTQVGVYFGINANAADRAKLVKVMPGEKYRFKVAVRSTTAIPVGGVGIYGRLYAPGTGTAYTWVDPSLTTNAKPIPANTWGEIDGIVTVPADTVNTMLAVGVFSQASNTGAARFSDLFIQQAITPALVVDGLVSGQNIIGAFIATQAAANRGVKITDDGLFAYSSTGVETLRFDGANSIITGATLRTAASGARWQMSATGLEAWGSDGVRYLLGNGSGLEMIGSISSKGKTADPTPKDISVRITTVTRNLMGKTNVPNPSLVFDNGVGVLGLAPGVYSPTGNELHLSGGTSGITNHGEMILSQSVASIVAERVLIGSGGLWPTQDLEIQANVIRLGITGGMQAKTAGILNGVWEISSNSWITGGTRHAELAASATLATLPSSGASTIVAGLNLMTIYSNNSGFATMNASRNTVFLEGGLYAITFKAASGSTLGTSARLAITNTTGVTHAAEVLTSGSWDGQVSHPNLYMPQGGNIQFQVRQNSGGNRAMDYNVYITKLS